VKSWTLRADGKYERTSPKPGAPLLRSQARFIEMTRDRVKSAEAAANSGRFHMGLLARPNIDAQVAEGRRSRREARESKKST